MNSTLTSLYNPRFSCHHCLNEKYPGRPEMLEREQKILGCKNAYSAPVHTVGNIKYRKCVGNYTDESCVEWFEAHEFFEKGVMPFPGNYVEQPAKIIEVMRVIGKFKFDKSVERAKKKHLNRVGKHGRQ